MAPRTANGSLLFLLPQEVLEYILMIAFYPGMDVTEALRALCNFTVTSTASLRAVKEYLSASEWLAARTLIAAVMAEPISEALKYMDDFLGGTRCLEQGIAYNVPRFSASIGRFAIAVEARHHTSSRKFFGRDYEFSFMSGQELLLRVVFNAAWGEDPGGVAFVEVEAPVAGRTFYLGDLVVHDPESNGYRSGYWNGKKRLEVLRSQLSCLENTDMYAMLVAEPLLQLVPDIAEGYLPIHRFATPPRSRHLRHAARRACALIESVVQRWWVWGDSNSRMS